MTRGQRSADGAGGFREWFGQAFRFGIVGFSNTVIGYLVYSAVLTILRRAGWIPEWDYLVAQAADFLLATLWSFYWNNRFVFGGGRKNRREMLLALLKTYVMYISTGLILGSVLLVVWVRGFGISRYLAPIINLLITVPLNFLLSKLWVFGRKEQIEEPDKK